MASLNLPTPCSQVRADSKVAAFSLFPSAHFPPSCKHLCRNPRTQGRSLKAARPQASSEPVFKEVNGQQGTVPQHDNWTVGDCMSTRLVTVTPSTTIEQALEMLVEFRITGLPVVDESGGLVGVVSDFDLLAIDEVLGKAPAPASGGLFPEPGSSWKAFKELQKLLQKTKGKTVGDVMTPHPLTVRSVTNLDEAARLLLGTKFRRLPVLDADGKLVGLLTRGNVVRAALEMRKDAESKSR